MAEDSGDNSLLKAVFEQGRDDPATYLWFFGGVFIGIAADIGSGGISLLQGTSGGGAAGLAAKAAFDLRFAKRKLRQTCVDFARFHRDSDPDKSRDFDELVERIDKVKNLEVKYIQARMTEIQAG